MENKSYIIDPQLSLKNGSIEIDVIEEETQQASISDITPHTQFKIEVLNYIENLTQPSFNIYRRDSEKDSWQKIIMSTEKEKVVESKDAPTMLPLPHKRHYPEVIFKLHEPDYELQPFPTYYETDK